MAGHMCGQRTTSRSHVGLRTEFRSVLAANNLTQWGISLALCVHFEHCRHFKLMMKCLSGYLRPYLPFIGQRKSTLKCVPHNMAAGATTGIEKLNVSLKQIEGWWIFYRNVFRCWKKTARGPFLIQHNKAERKYPRTHIALWKFVKLNLKLYLNPELEVSRKPQKDNHPIHL